MLARSTRIDTSADPAAATKQRLEKALRRSVRQSVALDTVDLPPLAMRIAKRVSTAIPIGMRRKHTAEALLSVNGEHYSGLGDVLPQLHKLGKYHVPEVPAELLEADPQSAAQTLVVAPEDVNRLVKDDGNAVKPLLYIKTASERARYKVKFGPGNALLWQGTGQPLAAGQYIFVVGADRALYAAAEPAKSAKRDVRHSSFFAGGVVLSAGELVVDAAGILRSANNKSGHYRPDYRSWALFLRFLQRHSVDIHRVEKTFVTKSKTQAVILKYLQIDGVDIGTVEQFTKSRA